MVIVMSISFMTNRALMEIFDVDQMDDLICCISGFFFCGITLEGDVNSSESSMNENSDVDHMAKSSEILLRFVIRIATAATYSATKSLVLVASMEFSTIP